MLASERVSDVLAKVTEEAKLHLSNNGLRDCNFLCLPSSENKPIKPNIVMIIMINCCIIHKSKLFQDCPGGGGGVEPGIFWFSFIFTHNSSALGHLSSCARKDSSSNASILFAGFFLHVQNGSSCSHPTTITFIVSLSISS